MIDRYLYGNAYIVYTVFSASIYWRASLIILEVFSHSWLESLSLNIDI
jgi:hypothetical protein